MRQGKLNCKWLLELTRTIFRAPYTSGSGDLYTKGYPLSLLRGEKARYLLGSSVSVFVNVMFVWKCCVVKLHLNIFWKCPITQHNSIRVVSLNVNGLLKKKKEALTKFRKEKINFIFFLLETHWAQQGHEKLKKRKKSYTNEFTSSFG